MTAACKEALLEIWEDALWTYGLENFECELSTGSSILAQCLCKQFKKLGVTREDILRRYGESKWESKPKAWLWWAFLAGNLITADGFTGLECPDVPEDALPGWQTPAREAEWSKYILIERGLSGDKGRMVPQPVKWFHKWETIQDTY